MAIPFATKNELKALDEKITAAEQTPVASARNTAPIYKHTIVMSGEDEGYIPEGENLTIVLYSTTNETLTAGPVDKQEIITKVFNNIISYESLSYPSIVLDNMNLPTGFVISSRADTGIAFICNLEYTVSPDAFDITNIISDTVGE